MSCHRSLIGVGNALSYSLVSVSYLGRKFYALRINFCSIGISISIAASWILAAAHSAEFSLSVTGL